MMVRAFLTNDVLGYGSVESRPKVRTALEKDWPSYAA